MVVWIVLLVCFGLGLWIWDRSTAAPQRPRGVHDDPVRTPASVPAGSETRRSRCVAAMRVLFVERSEGRLTIDGVATDDCSGLWGAVQAGAPVTMAVELDAGSPPLQDVLLATVDRWAEEEALIDVEVCDGVSGPSIRLSAGDTHVRFGLAA